MAARLHKLPFQLREIEGLSLAARRWISFKLQPVRDPVRRGVGSVGPVDALQLVPGCPIDEVDAGEDAVSGAERGDGSGLGIGIFSGERLVEKDVHKRRFAGFESPDHGDSVLMWGLIVSQQRLQFSDRL
jgi:hypothetical protein